MVAVLFCDESGNTGPDWANIDQPIFVHGGWLVPDDTDLSPFDDGIERLKHQYNLRSPELKTSQILKRTKASAILRDFFRLGMDLAAIPLFHVADKAYLLGAKVVETYFDPEYNQTLPTAFIGNAGRKKRIVEGLLGDEPLLKEFAGFHRAGVAPPPDLIRRHAGATARRLQDVGQLWAAKQLAGLTDKGIEEIQAEFKLPSRMRSTTGHTLFSVMQQLEILLRGPLLWPANARVVHDNLVRYDETLDLIRRLFSGPPGDDIVLRDGRSIPSSFPHITELSLEDSKAVPMLQMANLLCGYVRLVITKLKAGQPLCPLKDATISDLGDCLVAGMWEWNVSLELQERFAESLVRHRSGKP